MSAKLAIKFPPTSISRSTPISDLPDRMRVDEVAAALGVSSGCVYSMIANGSLRAISVGRLKRIPRSELARLMNGEDAGS